MAVSKLFNLLAITTLALFATTFNAVPVNALTVGGHQHLNRQIAHEGIAKRAKRSNSGRCKQRPTSSLESSSSTSATPEAPKTSSKAAEPAPSSSSAPAAQPTPAKAATSSSQAAAATSTKAAATTSTKAATPTAVNTGSSSGNGKIGIAWNGGNDPSLGNLVSSNTRWLYTWSPWAPTNAFGLEFIPMLWGYSQISDFSKLVVPGYAQNLLFVNEPNQQGQSVMSPQDAATLWQQQFANKGGEGYSLWSPAVTNAPDGETWMDSFLQACSGCAISHMALHFYGTNAQDLITYVQHWHDKYGRNIAITEFACQNFGGGSQPSQDEVWAFYKTVMPFLASQSYVDAIFPFGFLEDMGNVATTNQLMKGGKLTDLGNYIVYGPY